MIIFLDDNVTSQTNAISDTSEYILNQTAKWNVSAILLTSVAVVYNLECHVSILLLKVLIQPSFLKLITWFILDASNMTVCNAGSVTCLKEAQSMYNNIY